VRSDDALLHAWRAGDRDAGDELVQRHFDAVCRFFRSKLGDDVEDLIQRTFLDLLEDRDRIRSSTVRAWLFTVARHRLFDELRGRLRRPVDELPSCSIADLRTGASGRLARAQTEDLVGEAMKRLPLDAQIALELAYWEELSGAEIAAVLDISPHTVRSRLARARVQLREHVQALAEGPAQAEATLAGLRTRLPRPGR
jgi:RNA polymerase sigma factor (sigma-70 family)